MKPLHRSTAKAKRANPLWDEAHRPYLISATTGGQWTQTRRSKLPSFVGSTLCQLCHEHEGTAEHRFNCRATRPPGGWPTPSRDTACFADGLTLPRRQRMRDRGTLVLRLPVPIQ